jgi:hypothetical protein
MDQEEIALLLSGFFKGFCKMGLHTSVGRTEPDLY